MFSSLFHLSSLIGLQPFSVVLVVVIDPSRNYGKPKEKKMNDKSKIPNTEAVIHEIQRRGNIAPLALIHQTTNNVDIGSYSVYKTEWPVNVET